MSVSSTESLMGDISKSIKETNQPSKSNIVEPKKQQPKQTQEKITSKYANPSSNKNVQILRQKQDEAAIIKAIQGSMMSSKTAPAPDGNKNVQILRQKQEEAAIIKAMQTGMMTSKTTPAPEGNKNIQILRQKQDEAAIIKAMQTDMMSSKPAPAPEGNKNIQMLRQKQEEAAIIKAMQSSMLNPKTTQNPDTNKNVQILRQKQEEAAIIKAMQSGVMSSKSAQVQASTSGKKNKVIDNIKKSTNTNQTSTDVKEKVPSATSSPTPSQKGLSASPKNKTPELHFNYKKPRQYSKVDVKQIDKEETAGGRRSRERQRRSSASVEKKEAANEVISDKRLKHQLAFTNGSPDVVNELFKEIRSATVSPAPLDRNQSHDKQVCKENIPSKPRHAKQSMAYTVGTYQMVNKASGGMKKPLPRSSSPVLTTQGASSRVLKGNTDNILPDIPAVKDKIAKGAARQKTVVEEESGILNIENDAPKKVNKQFLPRKVEQQIVLDRAANAFMATENQGNLVQDHGSPSKKKITEPKNPTPPPSPVKTPVNVIDVSDIDTPANMTREQFETAVMNLKRFFIWSSIRNNVATAEEKQFEAENRFQDLLSQLKNSDGSEGQLLLKHNLTVASDVMSACSSDNYSTPIEIEQENKTPKMEKSLQEDTTSKDDSPRVGPVRSIGQNNQVLALAQGNEQAYREMLTLLNNEGKISEELAPIDGDDDEMIDGRMTADSLCSSTLLLMVDPDQDSLVDSERPTVISRGWPTISQGETPVSMMGHLAHELISSQLSQISSEDVKGQLDQQQDLVKKLQFLKFQQTADTVAHLQKGIAGFAMKTKPSEQTSSAAKSEINPELEEKIANITKLVQAELDDEKRRKRQQGVLVEEQGTSLDMDESRTLVPLTLRSLLNSSKWVKKEGLDTPESLEMKILKGMKPPKSMDRWKGMESWLRIHYFDYLDSLVKRSEENGDEREDDSLSLLHARCIICILSGAGATPVGLEADLEVYVGRNGKNDGRRGLDKFCRDLAEQIEKFLSHPHESTNNVVDGNAQHQPLGKAGAKTDTKASEISQALSCFLEVPNLRDCVSISTVVHATVAFLFSRHFPAFSVPRPFLKALRTVPYLSHKTGSVYQCVGVVSGYVNSVEIEEFIKTSETSNACADEYLKLEDKIGIISSPRGRVLFGPANIWLRDIRSESAETEPVTTESPKHASKIPFALPKILPIGQVVLFDAVCVIDTGASAVSKTIRKVSNKTSEDVEDPTSSQVNTNIEVKKVIYMVGTKITKIDDCKIGGMDMDFIGMYFYYIYTFVNLEIQIM